MKREHLFASFVMILLTFVLYTNAETLRFRTYTSPFELKGKCVILPSYNGGNTKFPFVFQRDCFYTGKDSKKMKVDEDFLGAPVTITDVQILNKGKTSEKFCLLFSNGNGEFSIVVPLCVNKVTEELKIFQTLFYHQNPHHAFQNDPYKYNIDIVEMMCYDYSLIKRIEENYLGKEVLHDYYHLKKGMTFIRFFYKEGNGLDYLYAEFNDGVKSEAYRVRPLGSKNEYSGTIRNYSLEDIENLFK